MQESVLRGDPVRYPRSADEADADATPDVLGPSDLPPVVPDFVGRAHALEQAEAHCLAEPDPGRAHVRTVAFFGPAGIGASSVAAELAHRVKRRFPDGHLLVRLDRAAGRSDGTVAVDQLLAALGVPDTDRLGTAQERERLYRSCTASRRLLLVIDGASSERQVRPLLPTGADCAAIVTSRAPLAGIPGVRHQRLRPLTAAESLSLLRRILGEDRVDREAEAARRITELCDGLPLAVRTAGVLLASRPESPLRRLAERLEDEDRRLAALIAGDLGAAPAIADAVSRCTPAQQDLLAALGARGARTVSAGEAAALVGVDARVAEDLLGGLSDHGLVGLPSPDAGDRYPVGHLARSYARTELRRHLADHRSPPTS